jgi:hypothetical protein
MKDAMLVGAAAVLGTLWWIIAVSKKKAGSTADFTFPAGARVTSQPLLTDTETSFYNLLQLAVQDHYLIFFHLPLWSFLSIDTQGKERSRLLKRMALTRVDFALVHPGSRQVEQVVQIEYESQDPQQQERQRVIESFLGTAGPKLVKVRSNKPYTIPELTSLLGLAAEE